MKLTAPDLTPLLRWPGLLLLATLGMLLLFQHVVRQAVEQGELRRRANAVLIQATWRCRVMPNDGQRDTCLQRLAAVPPDNDRLSEIQALEAAAGQRR